MFNNVHIGVKLIVFGEITKNNAIQIIKLQLINKNILRVFDVRAAFMRMFKF